MASFHGLSVDMDRAGPAARDTASVFRASEPDVVAKHPKKRCLRLDIYLLGLAIDVQGKLHECVPSHQTARSLVLRVALAKGPIVSH